MSDTCAQRNGIFRCLQPLGHQAPHRCVWAHFRDVENLLNDLKARLVEEVLGPAPADPTHPRGNDVRVLSTGTGDDDERRV